MSAEANASRGFLRRILPAEILPDRQRAEELAEQVIELRKELSDANALAAQRTQELTTQVIELRKEFAGANAGANAAAAQGTQEQLSNPQQLEAQVQQSEQRSEAKAQRSDDMERTREQTRGRIAFVLIGTLVAVVLGTIAYMTWLTTIKGMTPEEVINLMQGLGTTLLAPIVGLIGAVIGFYYGGQAAVQGTQSAAQAATEVAKEAATTAANRAARKGPPFSLLN